jgi:hypothetical protein
LSIFDLSPVGQKLAREINDAGSRAFFAHANVSVLPIAPGVFTEFTFGSLPID